MIWTGVRVDGLAKFFCFSDLLALSYGLGSCADFDRSGGPSFLIDDGCVDWIGVVL